MKKALYVSIENFLNNYENKRTKIITQQISPEYEDAINKMFERNSKPKTLYETVKEYINKLNNPNFYFKNGNLNEAAFYEYARIDKSTWWGIAHNSLTPKKKTLFKLIFALKLDFENAKIIMEKGKSSFDESDRLDLIVMALIDVKCYDVYEVYDVIEEYRIQDQKAKWPIDNPIKTVTENIYDTPEDKKRKEAEEQKKKQDENKKN